MKTKLTQRRIKAEKNSSCGLCKPWKRGSAGKRPVRDQRSAVGADQALKELPEPARHLPMEVWGKDHWSLLAFIECICVDYKGVLDNKRRQNMRCNVARHPLLGYWPLGERPWQSGHGTRLKNYFTDKSHQLPEHDDWDCVDDFEGAGLLVNEGSGINPIWKLTPEGLAITAKFRAFKANGGHYYQFTP